MILDCHVHICATATGHGRMSDHLLKSIPFRFMRWRFGMDEKDPELDAKLEELLASTIEGTEMLDGAVVLAFDAVHDDSGNVDWDRTHLYITNDYVIELAKRHPKMLFAASVHPYRKDAVAELERCVAAGAVMVKWLPITQGFNPADRRCIPFYEALAHHKVPLLSHTGWEHALPNVDRTVADPMLLQEALNRGVTVIAAHCGSRLLPWEIDYVPSFVRMALEHENFYGDTAALNVPGRWYAYEPILADPRVRAKLVHGSDWPILPIPPARRMPWPQAAQLLGEGNWLKRDILIKQKLGFDDAYWHRAGTLLRLSAAFASGRV